MVLKKGVIETIFDYDSTQVFLLFISDGYQFEVHHHVSVHVFIIILIGLIQCK